MTLPSNIDLVWLRATMVDQLGVPLKGDVVLRPNILEPGRMVDYEAGVIIDAANRRIPLDANGHFEVRVFPTDDPDVNPTGWNYHVTEPTGAEYNLDVPWDTPLLNTWPDADPADPLYNEKVIDLYRVGLTSLPNPGYAETIPGPVGPMGPQGEVGPAGPVGPQGPTGTSIVSTSVDGNGHLIIALSAGPNQDAGVVNPGPIGPQGQQGPPGDTGATGPKGDKGDTGDIGPTGPTGATGPQGSIGATGAAGATWYSGSGVPAAGTGANGDRYLHTGTGDVYLKTAGAWGVTGNIKGPQGATGAAGSQGIQGATGATGATGPTGKSVSSMAINGSKHLISTMSDASTIDAGLLPEYGSTVNAGGISDIGTKSANWDAKGVIAHGERNTDSNTSASTTFVGVLRLDDVPLKAGRMYEIRTGNLRINASTTGNSATVAVAFRTGGGNAVVGDPSVSGGEWQGAIDGGASVIYKAASVVATIVPGSDATYSFLLTFRRYSGSGTLKMESTTAGGVGAYIRLYVVDLGPAPSDTGVDI